MEMRQVPSYLKGLAETRARADADAQRLQKLATEIAEELAEAQRTVDSCDVLIRKFDSRLNPELIEPIRAWKGRYGLRGALRNSIERQLREAYPAELTTSEIAWALQVEFKLDFVHRAEKAHWQHNTVSRTLKVIVERGQAVPLHDVSRGSSGEVGRWRWISDDALSLDHLRAQTVAAGRAVQQCDDDHA